MKTNSIEKHPTLNWARSPATTGRRRCRRPAIARACIETLEHRRLLSFAAPVSYAVGAYPLAVATADFNGDGRSDVVTANDGASNVSVLLSNADGTLQPAQTFATGANPNGLAVGDVNNDGKRDIVTANAGGNNVSVLLGNGSGTFQPASNVTLPPQFPPGSYGGDALTQVPVSVAVGDLNADGKLDLAVGGQTSFTYSYTGYYGGTYYRTQNDSYVNVLLGNGNGTFGNASVYHQAGLSQSLGLADFNGDNKLDVFTAGSSGVFVLLPGNGNGTFQPPISTASGFVFQSVIGDFDSDEKLDLVARNYGSVNFFKGLGNGTFGPDTSVFNGDARSIVAGDVNADGKLDVVVSSQKTTYESYGYYGNYGPTTTESTKVLLGHGDGTFARGITSTLGSYAGLGSPPNASALGDVNGDTRPDLVVTDPATSHVSVQLNQLGWIIPGTLTINDAPTVTEGNTGTVNAVFTVTLAEAPAANVSVKYDVLDGTATLAGDDYVATSGTLTFTPGQTSKTISVPVKGDRVGEYQENFTVRLSDATNAEITRRDGVGTINDDEPWVNGFTGGTVTEGNSGTLPLTFTVTLSAPSDAPVTITYKTADYTAVSATDYVTDTGTLTFAPGQTTQTFTVPVKGDLVPENEEYFSGLLTGGTNVLIVNANQAYGTIKDTDPDPTISIANMTRAEGNSGTLTPFEFILTLSKPSGKEVDVPFSTASGSATSSGSSKDFYASSSFATFYPGQMFASAQINVIGDNRNELDETFYVNLSTPTNATIAHSQGVGTILNDESRGKTWVGPASGGSWSTASNWSPSGVPVATSLVHIDGASVTVSSSVTVDELSLVNYATLTVAPNGSRVLRTAGLFIDYYYSMLNLNDNNLIVDYTAATGSPLGAWNSYGYIGIAAMVALGNHYGVQYSEGIATGRPDALAGLTTLGIGEASQFLGITGSQNALFSGQTVDATTVLVKYTYRGDANLDGGLDIDDYTAIDYGISAGLNGWSNGDFNYDGKINIDDYLIIDSNLPIQGPPLLNGMSIGSAEMAASVWARQPGIVWAAGAESRDKMIDLLSPSTRALI